MAKTYRQMLVDRLKASSPSELLLYLTQGPDTFQHDASLATLVSTRLEQHDADVRRARALLKGIMEEDNG